MRILHTMLRVGNLERSIKFYTEVLGMKLLRTTDRPDQKYSLAFVGYDGERILLVGPVGGAQELHAEHFGIELDRTLEVADPKHGVQ